MFALLAAGPPQSRRVDRTNRCQTPEHGRIEVANSIHELDVSYAMDSLRVTFPYVPFQS